MGDINHNDLANVPENVGLTVFTDCHTDSPGITAFDPLFWVIYYCDADQGFPAKK